MHESQLKIHGTDPIEKSCLLLVAPWEHQTRSSLSPASGMMSSETRVPGTKTYLLTTTMSLPMLSNCAEKLTTALGIPINTMGLLALPDELLLLIVSFFPTCRIPEETEELLDNEENINAFDFVQWEASVRAPFGDVGHSTDLVRVQFRGTAIKKL